MALWIEDYVIKNKFSRCGQSLTAVKGIVVHWTATAGASDTNEQKFFDGEDGGGGRYASAHLFVDRDSATLTIPLGEVAYHANDHACRVEQLKPNANYTSIGVEMCVEKDNTIHAETIERTACIVAELCRRYGLDQNDIFRHYDVTGKNCPAPWVADVSKFNSFKNTVAVKLKKPATPVTTPPLTPPAKPTTPPVNNEIEPYVPKANGVIGKVKVLVDDLNIRVAPDTRASIVRKANKGEEFDVYVNQDDWHNVGGANWVFGGKGQYLALVPRVVMPSGVYSEGDKGDAVKQIQNTLNKLGFNCGTADGVWGAKTTSALKSFQTKYKLSVDGDYGAQSKTKMEELLN